MPKLFIVLLGLFVGILIWFKPVINLQHLLKDENISSVTSDGKSYSVLKGKVYFKGKELSLLSKKHEYQKVLQLASFYQLTKEEPLFIPYTIDPESLAKSVEFMDQEESVLLHELKFKDHIFPISFLKLLPQIVTTQKAFIDNPGDTKARELITLYFEAAHEYKQSSSQILNIVTDTISQKVSSKEITLDQFATNTTPKTVVNDLNTLVNNSLLLEDEITKRQKCLDKGLYCRDSISLVKSIDNSPSPPSSYNLISKNIVMPDIPDDMVKGPYQVTTPCMGFQNITQLPSYLYYVTSQFSNHSVRKNVYPGIDGNFQEADLATNAFFLRLSDNYTHEKFLKQHGLLFVLQTTTNPYICQNMEYLAYLGQLNNIFTEKKFLFANVPTDLISTNKQQLKQLGDQEKLFFNQKYPSDYELNKLGLIYLKAYKILKSQKNQQQNADLFLQTYLNIAFKMSNFNQILNKLTVNIGNFRRRKNFEVDNPLKKIYYYGFRSSYSLTYLVFSPGTWRMNKKPQYVVSGTTDNIGYDKRYVSFTQLREKYSESEILSWYWKQQELDRIFLQQNQELP